MPPSLLPGTVSGFSAVVGPGQVTMSWNAGPNGESYITDYTVCEANAGPYLITSK